MSVNGAAEMQRRWLVSIKNFPMKIDTGEALLLRRSSFAGTGSVLGVMRQQRAGLTESTGS